MTPVPPHSLDKAIAHIRAGGKLLIPTYTRCTVIDSKCLARWEAAGLDLLREEGEGYRMRTGRSSVYILPGQLTYA
jgi:hypothetical protein